MARVIDIAGAVAIIVVLAPVFLAIALWVWLCDGRPIWFRQKRIGKDGKPFLIVKFRTMRCDASGASLTASGDCRVTRLGGWLRRFKLDELPQFGNVLRGEMSLVGPRPEVPEYVVPEDECWKTVLRVRPGITDLATLAFRDEEDLLGSAADPVAYYQSVVLPEKLRLNILYLKLKSPVRDFKLLWMTALYSCFPWGFSRARVMRSLGM